MRSVFKNFEWKEEELNKLPKSDLANVHIKIDSFYQWGSGWTAEQEKMFENELYPKLIGAGFTITEGRMSGSSPTLTKASVSDNDKTSIYMHPMDFSGYASKKDIDTIKNILDSCKCINDVNIGYYKDGIYDISDEQYVSLIHRHTDEIEKCIAECQFKISKYDIGFDFAENCRLPRVNEKTGLSSLDCDIKAVEAIYDKYIEKTTVKATENKQDLGNNLISVINGLSIDKTEPFDGFTLMVHFNDKVLYDLCERTSMGNRQSIYEDNGISTYRISFYEELKKKADSGEISLHGIVYKENNDISLTLVCENEQQNSSINYEIPINKEDKAFLNRAFEDYVAEHNAILSISDDISLSFHNNADLMEDFNTLSKETFLSVHSDITETAYNQTVTANYHNTFIEMLEVMQIELDKADESKYLLYDLQTKSYRSNEDVFTNANDVLVDINSLIDHYLDDLEDDFVNYNISGNIPETAQEWVDYKEDIKAQLTVVDLSTDINEVQFIKDHAHELNAMEIVANNGNNISLDKAYEIAYTPQNEKENKKSKNTIQKD